MWKNAEEFLLKDKYISPLIRKWGRCTIKPRIHRDYFENLCGYIIGQQLSGKAADVIEARFKDKIGRKVTPNSVLITKDKILRDCGMSWGKVSFIKDLAQKTISGALQTKKLNTLTDQEIVDELVTVKGIGRWTAEMFLMFSLARPDIFPADDLGIKKGFEKVTGMKLGSDGSMKFAEKHWKPYRTVASWYLWRSLED